GGDLDYVMTAIAPETVGFMERAGMPLSTPCKVTYTEVSPMGRLAYKTLTDFVPGVEPYDVATVVEFKAVAGGEVRLTITFDAMHDEVWTERARAGHESQMRKLDGLLED
ncbi:MAG: activator of Hsp90 ATPase 1 family protein, partial [Caulobacteraceae bacterium]|nr:activator of Hsp90 ATPase 1 family protein [Caulobacteraceae bacterium]